MAVVAVVGSVDAHQVRSGVGNDCVGLVSLLSVAISITGATELLISVFRDRGGGGVITIDGLCWPSSHTAVDDVVLVLIASPQTIATGRLCKHS